MAKLLLFFILIVPFHSIKPQDDILKVTLLGTGYPQPLMERFGPSILVQAGSEALIFDAGRGCLQRLRQVNVSYDQITGLFITHLHSDHTVGIPDLWLTGWIVSRRKIPLNVYGPVGINSMIDNLAKAYAYDIKIRIEDDKAPAEGGKLLSSEIKEGTVYDKNGVKVIAFLVDHPPVVPAYGYRIEYKGHSVVFSGDTKYSENLIKHALGADLLIHEVVIAPDTMKPSDPKHYIVAHHTSPEQAAKIFLLVHPKLAVYTHIVQLYGHNEDELFNRTKVIYPGHFLIGEDLTTFSISDSVKISPPPSSKKLLMQ